MMIHNKRKKHAKVTNNRWQLNIYLRRLNIQGVALSFIRLILFAPCILNANQTHFDDNGGARLISELKPVDTQKRLPRHRSHPRRTNETSFQNISHGTATLNTIVSAPYVAVKSHLLKERLSLSFDGGSIQANCASYVCTALFLSPS
jgi:hypothetical protein